MFEKTLGSLIQGLRSNMGREEEYISECLTEIRNELTCNKNTLQTKSISLLKLWYLSLYGYDASWSAFHIVQVMSDTKYVVKRPAYSLCSAVFDEKTDVALLISNLLRKEFTNVKSGQNKSVLDTGLALSCLASMGTKDVCADLYSDVFNLLQSSNPYIRRKATICSFRIFYKCPKTILSSCFPKLREKLSDENPGVVLAAVTAIVELANLQAEVYLGLVPQFYHILVNCKNNNWLLIKTLKFFALLCPHEKRLSGKLEKPLSDLLSNTKSKSTEYEILYLILRFMHLESAVFAMAVDRLKLFIESTDKNLRYLGLSLLADTLQKRNDGQVINHIEGHFANLSESVLRFVDDIDPSVRTAALSMLKGFATRSSFESLAELLLSYHKTKPNRAEFLSTLLELATQDRYNLIEDFEWYIRLLADVAVSPQHEKIISAHLVDITVRVQGVRPCAVALSCSLVGAQGNTAPRPAAPLVVGAAAWIIGEYGELLSDQREFGFEDVCKALVDQATRRNLPSVKQVCLWSAVKLYFIATKTELHANLEKLQAHLLREMAKLGQNPNVEVSERAGFSHYLLQYFGSDFSSAAAWSWSPPPFVPVHPQAQSQVVVPVGLCLDTPFFTMEKNTVSSENEPPTKCAEPVINGVDGGGVSASPVRVPTHLAQTEALPEGIESISGLITKTDKKTPTMPKKKFEVLCDEASPVIPQKSKTVHESKEETSSLTASASQQHGEAFGLEASTQLLYKTDSLVLWGSVSAPLAPVVPDAPVTLRVELTRDPSSTARRVRLMLHGLEPPANSVDFSAQGKGAVFVEMRRSFPEQHLNGDGELRAVLVYETECEKREADNLDHVGGEQTTGAGEEERHKGNETLSYESEVLLKIPVTRSIEPLSIHEDQMNDLMQQYGRELIASSSFNYAFSIPTGSDFPSVEFLRVISLLGPACSMHVIPQRPHPTGAPVSPPTSVKALLVARKSRYFRTLGEDVRKQLPVSAAELVVGYIAMTLEGQCRVVVRSTSRKTSDDVSKWMRVALQKALERLDYHETSCTSK